MVSKPLKERNLVTRMWKSSKQNFIVTYSLATSKVGSGIEYMEQKTSRCDISMNETSLESVKCEKNPRVEKKTGYDTKMRIKTEINDGENEIDVKEHELSYELLKSENCKTDMETIKCKQNVESVKCEKSPKVEKKAGYDTEMRIKSEIKDEIEIEEHEVNYLSTRTEDYKIDPGREFMEQTTDEHCILSSIFDFDHKHDNDVKTIKREQIVGQDADGIEICLKSKKLTSDFKTKYKRSLEQDDDVTENLRCKLCNYKTKIKGNLLQHHISKHDDLAKVFCCELCDFKTRFKNYLPHHHRVKHHSGAEIFHCKMCNFRAKSKSYLLRHHRTVHVDKAESFRCALCDLKFKCKSYLVRHHKSKHDATKIFHCALCEFRTKFKRSLLDHHRLKHDDDEVEIFCCELCGFKTKYKRSLLKHHSLKHDDNDEVEVFHCEVCDFKTKYKSTLLEHHTTQHHDAAEIIYCALCDYKTKCKRYLLKHHRSKHKDGA